MYILWHAAPLYRGIRKIVGAHLTGAWVAEVAVAASGLLLPTALIGATFAHLAQAATRNGLGLGRALAVNTLGGAIAPALFGVLLLPAFGSVAALTLAALGYAALLPRPNRAGDWLRLAVPAGLAGSALL